MNYPNSSYGRQRGASLFIALIMLLLITLLAVASVREAILESRITGTVTLEQRLANAAEAGLRDGEYSVTSTLQPVEPTSNCTSGSEESPIPPCLLSDKPTYSFLFGSEGKSRAYGPKDATQAPAGTAIDWYAMTAPDGSNEGASSNAMYGSNAGFNGGSNVIAGGGSTIIFYEVNSRATSSATGANTTMRSTTAKVFSY